MIFHMRTTLIISDELFRELKKRAAAERRTLSDVTQEALRRGLDARTVRGRRRRRLPVFNMGPAQVDIADRERLLDVVSAD
jgi:hypothetical protein